MPFKALLPRLAALVHHGGIDHQSGLAGQYARGLVRPMGFDQFDNPLRVLTLASPGSCCPDGTVPEAVAKALDSLVTDPSVRARCAEVARTLRADAGTAVAADALLALASRAGL